MSKKPILKFSLFNDGGGGGCQGYLVFSLQITMWVLFVATTFDPLHPNYRSCCCTYYLLFFNIFHCQECQVTLFVVFVLCCEIMSNIWRFLFLFLFLNKISLWRNLKVDYIYDLCSEAFRKLNIIQLVFFGTIKFDKWLFLI